MSSLEDDLHFLSTSRRAQDNGHEAPRALTKAQLNLPLPRFSSKLNLQEGGLQEVKMVTSILNCRMHMNVPFLLPKTCSWVTQMQVSPARASGWDRPEGNSSSKMTESLCGIASGDARGYPRPSANTKTFFSSFFSLLHC